MRGRERGVRIIDAVLDGNEGHCLLNFEKA
jgi:hypothetical protein